MAKIECKVQIHLPLKNKVPDIYQTGHFDIQIMDVLALTVDKKLKGYVNPVISYGNEGVSIYEGGYKLWSDEWMMCTHSFYTTSVEAVEKWIDDYCTFKTEGEDGRYSNKRDIYTVTSGEFQKNIVEQYNCFAAAAEWCNLMGYSTLQTIYNQCTYPNGTDMAPNLQGYKKYLAWPMFKEYYPYWTFEKLHKK